MLREPSSGYSSNCDEAMFRVQKSSLSMFWEYSASSTNLASDWLRTKSSPVDEEERKEEEKEKKKKKMDDGVARYFTRFGGVFFICCLGGAALSLASKMI